MSLEHFYPFLSGRFVLTCSLFCTVLADNLPTKQRSALHIRTLEDIIVWNNHNGVDALLWQFGRALVKSCHSPSSILDDEANEVSAPVLRKAGSATNLDFSKHLLEQFEKSVWYSRCVCMAL